MCLGFADAMIDLPTFGQRGLDLGAHSSPLPDHTPGFLLLDQILAYTRSDNSTELSLLLVNRRV
jgi:CRISPR/Cas system-associated endonuclease Cas1